jgi:hypothetical protein
MCQVPPCGLLLCMWDVAGAARHSLETPSEVLLEESLLYCPLVPCANPPCGRDAWRALGALEPSAAKEQYVQLASEVVPGTHSPVGIASATTRPVPCPSSLVGSTTPPHPTPPHSIPTRPVHAPPSVVHRAVVRTAAVAPTSVGSTPASVPSRGGGGGMGGPSVSTMLAPVPGCVGSRAPTHPS